MLLSSLRATAPIAGPAAPHLDRNRGVDQISGIVAVTRG
jgi:hypothetical protein